jgi:hypothetical protein
MQVCNMSRSMLKLGLVAALVAPWADTTRAADDEKPAVRVILETKEAEDLKSWGEKVQKLVEEWHPKISKLLASDGFKPPTEIKLVFKKDMKNPGATAGSTVFISTEWVTKHPEDVGMVIHELTHAIQAYPKYDHGWLVEGIADYIRFFHFEPDARLGPIDPARAKYKDGYRTTAAFLNHAQKHNPELVLKLNAALRKNQYKEEMFEELTGKSADALWAEFVETLKKKKD